MKKIRQSHRCNSGSAIILGVTLFILAILQPAATKGQAENIPLYGNWKTYSTKDGLPSNKVSCVRIDEDRIWAGTSEGLALYEDDKWTVFTTEDGLAHDGVLSIDSSSISSISKESSKSP